MSRVLELHTSSNAMRNEEIFSLLDFLPVLYPNGDTWLIRALSEVESGDADGLEVRVDSELAGVLLGQLKANGRYKIRTLFVAPKFRARGIGRALLQAGIEAAAANNADRAYITFAHTIATQIEPLLRSEGFEPLAYVQDRYGAGRDEVVFQRAI